MLTLMNSSCRLDSVVEGPQAAKHFKDLSWRVGMDRSSAREFADIYARVGFLAVAFFPSHEVFSSGFKTFARTLAKVLSHALCRPAFPGSELIGSEDEIYLLGRYGP